MPSTPRSRLLKLAGMALSVLLLSAIGFLPYHADAQTPTNYLSYQNKQYGFSIKYPSNWEKAETLTKSSVFPNVLDIVTFSTPSDLTSYGVSLIKDDTTFRGLSGQKFLDKIKVEFVDSMCSKVPAGVTCSTEVAQQTTLTHKNGYSGYLMIFGLKVSSDQDSFESGVVLAFYPDRNDVWIIGAASSSGDEFQQYTNELATIGSSFTISNYKGKQTTTASQPSTVAKSSVGTLQINSGNFAVSKYKPAELIVSGEINNYLQGVPLTLKILKPDKTTEEQNILVTKDGKFKTPIKLDGNWPAGSYRILAKYGSADLGSVSFQINTGDATTSKSTTQQQTTTQKQTTTKPSNTQTQLANQRQFQLNVKVTQENDLVTITITNPKDSSTNIYGIKLTTVTGKIKNYLQVNGWDHKRVSDNTVMYQTKSAPLKQSDVIKIKLKVDAKKAEIQWEAYSKDIKSLATGKVKT